MTINTGKYQIAYLIDTLSCDTSGTEKQLLETIRRIDKNKFTPQLICLRGSAWMNNNPLPCPCTVLGYEGLLKPSLPGVLKRLRNVVARENIHILQTFFEDSIFVAWLATRFSKRDIVLLSSRRDMGLGEGNQPWYHQLFAKALPAVNKSFDGIVANSRQVKAYVAKREKTPPAKIEVIYNGVHLPGKTDEKLEVFTAIPADIRIAIVASLTPVKRHDVLIKAIAALKKKLNNQVVQVVVLGKGPEKEKLLHLVQQENVQEYFCFEGAVQNVAAYLQHVDIGVLCSDREGLSNAILEYMANGLPVVATAVGGNTELVSEENGRCFPVGDPEAFAEALYELITDEPKRHQMGIMSQERVEKKFSWQSSMQHLEGYYLSLLAGKKGIVNDQ